MPENAEGWLSQRIVELAQDAIIFADRDGTIRLWNASEEIVFGYPTDEAVGQTLDLIIPPRSQRVTGRAIAA